jgi:RNA polymerase sigma-70 factor (ECF subfamily)
MKEPLDDSAPLDQDRSEFASLMESVRQGSEDAARTLFDRYGPHIRRVVRRKLHQKLRPQFDSLDFVQDVWASFFTRQGRQATFDSPEALIGFLSNMAYHKVIDAFRHNVQTKKRDVDRDRPLDQVVNTKDPRLAARLPTPSQVAVAKEQWDQLLDRVPEHYRPILTLLREGDTREEIARKLGLNEKTVQRVLRRIAPEEPGHDPGR